MLAPTSTTVPPSLTRFGQAQENGLPDYEGGIVAHEFLRELADHLEADE